MNSSINPVVTPVRQSWRGLIDKLTIGDTLHIPIEKMNSVSNIISMKFHLTTKKRFTVTYKDEPEGQAKVTRLKDAED